MPCNSAATQRVMPATQEVVAATQTDYGCAKGVQRYVIDCITETDMSAIKKLIRLRELLALIGIGRATLYDWLNSNSPRYDPSFPKQIRLGRSSVAWVAEEVDAWIQRRIAAREVAQD